MLKKILILSFFLFTFSFLQLLQAETDIGLMNKQKILPSYTIKGSVCFVSDYRYRGLSQTMRRPAVQGTLECFHQKGIYAGTFGSNVDGTTHYYNNTSLEWDFYGGYKNQFFPSFLPDMTYNIGLIYYCYPGGQTKTFSAVKYNTKEFYIELSYKEWSFRYWHMLTDYFGLNSNNAPFNWKSRRFTSSHGDSKGSFYLDFNFSKNLYENLNLFSGGLKGGSLNLLLHLGHQKIRHYSKLSYTEWKATLMQTFAWFNIFLSYVGTTGKGCYYKIFDHAYFPHKRSLAGQELILGVVKLF